MKILAFDSSASPASVALVEEKKILAQFFINTGFTHSQTLMPMIESVFQATVTSIDDIDLLAVSTGPGSFTGVRIGVATAKGLLFGRDIPCVGVSTLHGMAYNFIDDDCIVFSVMDARRSQVYNGIFEVVDGEVIRLCEDRAIAIDELEVDIKKYCKKKIFLVGDGANLCYNILCEKHENVFLPCESRRYQCAYGIALAATQYAQSTSDALMPSYLRPSQAERELKLKR